MAIYSHSKLSSFEQCRLKYKLRYIDKIKPEIETTIEAHLGTCTHDTLEWIYKEVKRGITPTIEQVIDYYSEVWQKKYSERILIVKKEFDSKYYFERGVGFILNYYQKHSPFKDGTLELEKRLMIVLGESGEYKLTGFIDRLVYNKEKDEYEIHDYKTAKTIPPQEKIDSDRQLALYSIGIKDLYGKNKSVLLTWHYLAHNEQIFSRRTDEQLERLKQDIINLIKEIELATEFPATESILCNWCEYKPICPKHGGTLPQSKEEQQQIKDNYPTISRYMK
jgi:putative RecB family exonuclease